MQRPRQPKRMIMIDGFSSLLLLLMVMLLMAMTIGIIGTIDDDQTDSGYNDLSF
jgi:hypothetical protein